MKLKLRKYKPVTSSSRHRVVDDRSLLAAFPKGSKKIVVARKKSTGRNRQGKITVRRRGGGVKRNYRVLDTKRDKHNIQGEVVSLEYDPNRTANIALICYKDGEKRYIFAPKGLKIGDKVISGLKDIPLQVGNCMPLKEIPSGVFVHNVEIYPNQGGQLGRSAGASIQVQGVVGKNTQLKLPSGEIRLINSKCFATIGVIGNEEHLHVKLGKAGVSRKLGRRPKVRGVAMHAQQHPHGGGEGRTGTGRPASDIWGNRVGRKTRRNKRTDRFIVKKAKSKRK